MSSKDSLPAYSKNSMLAAHSGPQERGFILLEVLVAILIFSFGILGLVGLQANMINEQSAAKYRSDAGYLAGELTGLIWADVTNIGSYAGSVGSGNCASYARCKDWASKVAATLPAGSSTVVTDSTTGDVAVTIGWSMPGGNSHRYLMATTIVAADKN